MTVTQARVRAAGALLVAVTVVYLLASLGTQLRQAGAAAAERATAAEREAGVAAVALEDAQEANQQLRVAVQALAREVDDLEVALAAATTVPPVIPPAAAPPPPAADVTPAVVVRPQVVRVVVPASSPRPVAAPAPAAPPAPSAPALSPAPTRDDCQVERPIGGCLVAAAAADVVRVRREESAGDVHLRVRLADGTRVDYQDDPSDPAPPEVDVDEPDHDEDEDDDDDEDDEDDDDDDDDDDEDDDD